MRDEFSKLDGVLQRLVGVRQLEGDNRFEARCPAHESKGRRNNNLSIRLGRKWINLNCYAGCDFMSIVRALGLRSEDLLVEDEEQKVRARPISQRQRELTAMACAIRLSNEQGVLDRLRFERGWAAAALEMLGAGYDGSRITLPVRDADGKLHDTLRYDPFATSGRKVLAGRGKSRLPFPAPESLTHRVCFLVEGEGTAISMFSVGLQAVGLPGSMPLNTNVARPGMWRAGGWHRSWARRFAHFRELVLFPDCDGPGRALMGAARYDLEREGLKTTLVDLGKGLHDGSDVADILLRRTVDGDSRRKAKNILREIVAEHEVLIAA